MKPEISRIQKFSSLACVSLPPPGHLDSIEGTSDNGVYLGGSAFWQLQRQAEGKEKACWTQFVDVKRRAKVVMKSNSVAMFVEDVAPACTKLQLLGQLVA